MLHGLGAAMAGVGGFIDAPSEKLLEQCSREQLVKIADHYDIAVGDKRLKENVKVILKENVYDMGVLIPPKKSPSSANRAGAVSQTSLSDLSLNFEQQKEMLRLRMQLELELERVRQQADLEKALALEKMRQQTEMARLDLESERLSLIKEGKLCDMSRSEESVRGRDNSSDILNSLRLVPKFHEKEVYTFFTLFERVAEARGWVESDRIDLLQCVLTGRAQEAFSSLTTGDSSDYQKVKVAVLKAYELVPEAYRQRFRNWRKGDK